MVGKRYRLNTPTLAIMVHDGQHSSVTVPAGDVVKVTSGPLDENRLVEVEWKGKVLLMFAIDLRERGEPVDEDED
jgi:hypothetical protein